MSEPNFDELNEQADKGELTQEALQAQLNAYATALQQEFEQSLTTSPENTEEYTRDFFKKNIHSMAAQVVWLANNGSSESVRLSACKFGINQALQTAHDDGDPIKQLLADLTANAKGDD